MTRLWNSMNNMTKIDFLISLSKWMSLENSIRWTTPLSKFSANSSKNLLPTSHIIKCMLVTSLLLSHPTFSAPEKSTQMNCCLSHLFMMLWPKWLKTITLCSIKRWDSVAARQLPTRNSISKAFPPHSTNSANNELQPCILRKASKKKKKKRMPSHRATGIEDQTLVLDLETSV